MDRFDRICICGFMVAILGLAFINHYDIGKKVDHIKKLQQDLKAHETQLQLTHEMMLEFEEEFQAKIKKLNDVVFEGAAENPKLTLEDIPEWMYGDGTINPNLPNTPIATEE